MPVTYQAAWEIGIPIWAPKLWFPKSPFQFFSFSSCISTKRYVEVAISDFTIHLIISKWLRIMQTEEKNKEVEAIEETVNESVFNYLTTY